MKKIHNYLFIIIFCAVQLNGQNDYQTKISAGISFPISPNSFTEYWNYGVNYNGALGAKLKANIYTFINFEYYNYSFDEGKFRNKFKNLTENKNDFNNNCKAISVFPSLNINLRENNSTIIPSIYFGIGWLWYSTNDALVHFIDQSVRLESETKSQIILLIGFGATYNLNQLIKFFIETNYRYGSIDNDRLEYIPLKIGVELSIVDILNAL